MWTALVTVVPVGLVLGLLAFGHYGERRPPYPTPRRMAPVAAATLLLGPVAAAVVGLLTWLVLVVLVAAGILMVAMLRTPAAASLRDEREQLGRERGRGHQHAAV